jgi:type II secretory pathway pseudopilin PulG/predicted nucleic acid-binding Zn ribbon protein
MFCATCGGAIPEGGGFCVKCGAPARPILTPDGRLKRPGVITLLAILQFIGGTIWLLIGGVGLALATTANDREPIAQVVFALFLVLAGFQLACGVGLWKLKPYGWWLQIISSSIGLLAIPVGTIISIVILIYLNKPGVKLLFSDKPVESMTPEEQGLVAAATVSSTATTVIVAAVGVLVLIALIGIVAAIAIPGLLRARIAGNEAVAIGQLRAFTSAQTSYALGNRMLFDRQECLLRPSDCVAGYAGPAFLQERLDQKSGYQFAFYPGLAPDTLPDGASRSSMTGYVLTARPISDSTGQRQFCVDQTGDVRSAPMTAELSTDGPSCPASWRSVR